MTVNRGGGVDPKCIVFSFFVVYLVYLESYCIDAWFAFLLRAFTCSEVVKAWN